MLQEDVEIRYNIEFCQTTCLVYKIRKDESLQRVGEERIHGNVLSEKR